MPVVAEIDLTHAACELWVNGIAVHRFDGAASGATSTAQIQDYLIPGENLIEAVVDPGATPSVSRQPHPPTVEAATGRITVFFPESWNFDREKEPVQASMEWEHETLESAPKLYQTKFTAPEGTGRPAWLDASKSEFDENALGLAQSAQTAIQDGDAATLARLMDLPIQNTARTNGTTIEAERDNLSNVLEHVLKDKPQTPSVPREDWDIRSFRESTIHELIAKDWKPIVRRGEPPKITAVAMRVGVLDGKWRVLL